MKSLGTLLGSLPDGLVMAKLDKALDLMIFGVTADSTKCHNGFLFVAVRGATKSSRDGHDFVEYAIKSGAVAVVVDESFPIDWDYPVPLLKARDSKTALCFLAEAFFDFPSRKLKVIGITGTNGKTSTTFMLHNILKMAGHNPKIMGTLGFGDPGRLEPLSHTTMDPEFLSHRLATMHDQGVTHVIMEISSHALSLKRVEAIKFSAVGLTNITQDHLDFHETLAHYQAAKARLFFELADDTTHKLLPLDHPFRSLVDDLTSKILYSPTGSGVLDGEVILPFFGDFHLKNAALATEFARVLAVSEHHIRQGLATCPKIPGRLEIIDHHHPFQVVVDFAHTPHALWELLTTVKKLSAKRIILVFGCGGDRDRLKRPLMGNVASNLADVIIVTDDNPRTEDPKTIRQEILAGISNLSRVLQIPDRRAAIDLAIRKAEKNDLVVIAGKGHENYQTYGKNSVHHSDQEEARKVLDKL